VLLKRSELPGERALVKLPDAAPNLRAAMCPHETRSERGEFLVVARTDGH
jgi:hypothetical protein